MTGDPTSGAPGPVLRRVRGPLFLYHLLILAGAFLLLYGLVVGNRIAEIIGAILIVAGVAIEVAILVWSARLIRAAAAAPRPDTRTPAATGPSDRQWLCLRCAARGTEPGPICPRCGYSRIRVYGFSPSSDRPG